MRRYAFTFPAYSTTGAVDLLRITPPANKSFRVVECHVTRESGSTAAQVAIASYLASTAGGGGTVVTPVALDNGDAAFGGSARGGLTSIATKEAQVDRQGLYSLAGYHYRPLKPSRPVVGQHFVVRLESTTASALVWCTQVVVVIDG